jgi:hypothetical protein
MFDRLNPLACFTTQDNGDILIQLGHGSFSPALVFVFLRDFL